MILSLKILLSYCFGVFYRSFLFFLFSLFLSCMPMHELICLELKVVILQHTQRLHLLHVASKFLCNSYQTCSFIFSCNVRVYIVNNFTRIDMDKTNILVHFSALCCLIVVCLNVHCALLCFGYLYHACTTFMRLLIHALILK